MTSLVWLQWGTPLVHAFVVTDGERAERSLCNNYPGRGSTAVVGDPVENRRCSTCDDRMRMQGKKQHGPGRPRRDVYTPVHTFREWE